MAQFAQKFCKDEGGPRHRKALRHWGGGLLVGSIALIGLAFAFI